MKENQTIKNENENENKSFIYKSSKYFMSTYEVIKKLDAYEKRYEINHKKTGEIFFCVHISKLKIKNIENFKRIINMLINSEHPNIIKILEIYESKRSFYLVMEEFLGGDLSSKILENFDNKIGCSEKEAAKLLQQIISSIEYYNNNGIYIFNLEPENIYFLNSDQENDNPIKLIEYGQSKFAEDTFAKKIKYCIAPEAIEEIYTEKTNIWSAGVILYMLLSNEPPFDYSNHYRYEKEILKMKYDFPEKKWKNISNDAKDLITHMIAPEKERYTSKQVLEHPWFKKVSNLP